MDIGKVFDRVDPFCGPVILTGVPVVDDIRSISIRLKQLVSKHVECAACVSACAFELPLSVYAAA